MKLYRYVRALDSIWYSDSGEEHKVVSQKLIESLENSKIFSLILQALMTL